MIKRAWYRMIGVLSGRSLTPATRRLRDAILARMLAYYSLLLLAIGVIWGADEWRRGNPWPLAAVAAAAVPVLSVYGALRAGSE